MQTASKFAQEWTANIVEFSNIDWGDGSPTGYLGTMGCHLDEVCDDLMREGVSWEVIHDLDIHAPGDDCTVYAGERGPIEFRPTMSEAELSAALHSLAVLVGLPE